MSKLKPYAYWVKVFLCATAVALGMRLFVVETFRIQSDSMLPNLHDGDIILTSKFNYNVFFPFTETVLFSVSSPQVGAVVVHQLPDKPNRTYIKRVVAIGGDTVEIKNGVLIVNQVPAQYELAGENWRWERRENASPYLVTHNPGKDLAPIEVPPGYFFVLGDNRSESVDSRVWGPLPHHCLRAKLGMVWARSPRVSSPAPEKASETTVQLGDTETNSNGL